MTDGGFTGVGDIARVRAGRLFGDIESFGDALAVIDETGARTSYRELARRADDRARPLGAPGRLVLIQAANAIAPLELYIGALRAGHAVILTGDDATSADRLAARFQPGARYRREGDRWALTIEATDGPDLHPDLAVMLSTSGSTGSPKLVRLSHANLYSNARAIADYLEFAPGERAITSLPPYYSYGLSVIHSHLLLGHSLVLSTLSPADDGFWRQVRREGVTSFAGVPHSYELLAAKGFLAQPGPPLRYMTQAGGRLAPETVVAFADHAQAAGTRFYVMYGQTEASPRMAFVPPGDIGRHPDVIGIPIPGGAFRIEPIDGEPGLADGAGELIYTGPNVMMGYASAAPDLRLGQGPSDLRTGDIARKGADGYYRIVGRRSRFAKLFGLRIAFDELEGRLAALDLPSVVTGDDDGIVVTTTLGGATARITDLLVRLTGLPSAVITVNEVRTLPRLSSGKLDYAAMARGRTPSATRADKPLREAFSAILGGVALADDDSFVSRGGDSLSYIEASLVVEQHLGRHPAGWERMCISDLEALANGPREVAGARPGVRTLEASILVRALAILLVLVHHASQLPMGGAADALLVTAGVSFGRFQVPRVLAGGLLSSLASTGLKIVLPYFVMLSLLFVYVGEVFWPQYLLVSNFTSGLVIDGVRRLQIYWFMETYLLLFLGLSIALAWPPARRLVRRHAWSSALTAALVGMCLRFWSTLDGQSFLLQAHTPFALAWLFTLGWLIAVADTFARRCVAAILAICGMVVAPTLGGQAPVVSTLVLAAFTILLVGGFRVPVGRQAARFGGLLASASLYIYIAQPIILQPLARVSVAAWQPLIWVMAVALCIALGASLWAAVRVLERHVGTVRSGLLRRGANRPAAHGLNPIRGVE